MINLFKLKWITIDIDIYPKIYFQWPGRIGEYNKFNLKTIELSHSIMFIRLKFKLKIG